VIGVAVREGERAAVEEFFELFKTPWEFAAAGRSYPLVVSTIGRPRDVQSNVLIAYGATELDVDREAQIVPRTMDGLRSAQWGGSALPLYLGVAQFGKTAASTIQLDGSALDYRVTLRSDDVWRIGFDLFREVQHLLTDGQPPSCALIPTLELHIALLRHLMVESQVSFVEVAPRPSGAAFVCCLTHDVDFFGIRRHTFDRTLGGFVGRASLGTLIDLVRSRRTLGEALRNWTALASLPLVFLRLWPDLWRPIDDYSEADGKRPSTFFVVPFRDRPGVGPDGRVDRTRAVKYQASEVAGSLKRVLDNGGELAVHGIDAWRDAAAGRKELEQVAAISGRAAAGVRMHWLYFDREAPARLQEAGFDYDSTCGYNDAIGYRAGTPQVFQLPGTSLLELPLTIMDSAMFYPDRMGLQKDEALSLCRRVVADAERFGGAVVINWHERSLAPERQWGATYRLLLKELDSARTWFTTATEAVDWFRWRRSIKFDVVRGEGNMVVRISGPSSTSRGATVRAFRAGALRNSDVTESQYDGGGVVEVDFPVAVGNTQ
jgi:hypothetical protein